MIFGNVLIKWYLDHKRDLPWRHSTDPYLIWLSEIMLQQTRVAQGLPYFLAFTNAFPTVFDLANASEEQVLKLWQGLGYYSRARNLHQTAQFVANECEGNFPNSYKELLLLKGVGEYTAAAIASFSYNEPVPVVDGNVFRVLSRIFDLESDIAFLPTRKEFYALAFELMPKDQPAIFNQAMMEFGALQCTPKSPDCSNCVFNTNCLALQKRKVALLPFKSKKTKTRNRFFNYLVVEDAKGHTLVQKRTSKGIWHNLYEFPLMESEAELSLDALAPTLTGFFNPELKIKSVREMNSNPSVHKLSHQHLYIKFWKISIEGTIADGIDYETLLSLPFPIVIFNFITQDFMK
jgi:A/G-specific adenine glycosylase